MGDHLRLYTLERMADLIVQSMPDEARPSLFRLYRDLAIAYSGP